MKFILAGLLAVLLADPISAHTPFPEADPQTRAIALFGPNAVAMMEGEAKLVKMVFYGRSLVAMAESDTWDRVFGLAELYYCDWYRRVLSLHDEYIAL